MWLDTILFYAFFFLINRMGRTVCRLLHFRSKRNPANDFQIIKTFTSHGRQSKAKKAGNQLTFSSSLSLSLTKELLMLCATKTYCNTRFAGERHESQWCKYTVYVFCQIFPQSALALMPPCRMVERQVQKGLQNVHPS